MLVTVGAASQGTAPGQNKKHQPTERIVNGGFETGRFYWQLDNWTAGDGWGLGSGGAHTGQFLAWHRGTTGGLSQSIDFTKVPTLSFWVYGYAGQIQDVIVKIDSTTVFQQNYGVGWNQYSVDVSAYPGVHTLTFSYGDINYFSCIDDVSAIANPILGT